MRLLGYNNVLGVKLFVDQECMNSLFILRVSGKTLFYKYCFLQAIKYYKQTCKKNKSIMYCATILEKANRSNFLKMPCFLHWYQPRSQLSVGKNCFFTGYVQKL